MAYIIGTGSFAHHIKEHFQKANIEFHGFLEFTAIERPVQFELLDSQELDHSQIVMVGIHNPEVDVREVEQKVRNAGFKNVISPNQALHFIGNLLNPVDRDSLWGGVELYWMSHDVSYLHRPKTIGRVLEKLCDEASKTLFRQLLEYRLSGQTSLLGAPSPLKNQYFDDDFSDFLDLRRVMDCGAYRGDTLESLAQRPEANSAEIYYGFEPDPRNFQVLLDKTRQTKFECYVFPVAVGSRNKLVKFEASGKASSAIGRGSDFAVQVRVDDLFQEVHHEAMPTFIKFDIEGMELDALRGLERIIKDVRPQLAVSIYHRPTDIFEIFAYLDAIHPDYNFYLRTYAQNSFDTVLYAF